MSFVLEGLGCDLFGLVGLMRNFWFASVLVFCVGYFVWAGWVLVGLGLGFFVDLVAVIQVSGIGGSGGLIFVL